MKYLVLIQEDGSKATCANASFPYATTGEGRSPGMTGIIDDKIITRYYSLCGIAECPITKQMTFMYEFVKKVSNKEK